MDGFGTVFNSFKGRWTSSEFSGDAAIDISSEGITASSGSTLQFVPHNDIFEIVLNSWSVSIVLADETVTVSFMGQELEWLYQKLWDAYNEKTLRALFVEGECMLGAKGAYRVERPHGTVAGDEAVIKLFSDCFCILPPNCSALRVPWYMVYSIDTDDYEIRVSSATGDTITLNRLGHEHNPFVKQAEICRQQLLTRSTATFTLVDTGLPAAAAVSLARAMPDGTGASLEEILRMAPSLPDTVAAYLKKRDGKDTADIDSEETAETCDKASCFTALRSLVTPDRLFLGIKSRHGDSNIPESSALDFWFAAFSPDRRTALIEYALADEEQSATYFYRFEDADPEHSLWQQVNWALEALGRNRECILLSDQELGQLRYSTYAMALKRVPLLRFLRKHLTGRIIHTTSSAWAEKVRTALEG